MSTGRPTTSESGSHRRRLRDEDRGVHSDAAVVGGTKDSGLVIGGDQPLVEPPLDGGGSLADGGPEVLQAVEQSYDIEGGRGGADDPLVAAHTHNYAQRGFTVNVESGTAPGQKAAVPSRPPSIGLRLRALLGRSGLTMAQLALAMGYRGPSSLQRYLADDYGENGTLPVKMASRLVKAMAGKGEPPVTAAEIYALAGVGVTVGGVMYVPNATEAPEGLGASTPSLHRIAPDGAALAVPTAMQRDLPVYGTALGSELTMVGAQGANCAIEQTALNMAEPIDYVRRPPALVGRQDAYALYVVGDSMYPRFRDGDTIVVDPRRQAAIGDDVVIQLRNGNGHDESEQVVAALVKRLVRRTAAFVELEQFSPACQFRVPTEQIMSLHLILSVGAMVAV